MSAALLPLSVAAPGGPPALRCAMAGRSGGLDAMIKRAVDLMVILLLAPLWAPLLGMLAMLVALDGGPVLRVEWRVGQYGRLFAMVRFRVLRRGAAGQLARLLADPGRRQQWIAHGALLRDPRLTRAGRWLRRTGLQDLPLVWHVIRGDMALVGPRARLPGEMQRDLGAFAAQLVAVRPGLIAPVGLDPLVTGNQDRDPWSGGQVACVPARLTELAYARSGTLRSDIAILARHLSAIRRRIWRPSG